MAFKLKWESVLLYSSDPADRAQDEKSFPKLAAAMLFHQPNYVPPSTLRISKLHNPFTYLLPLFRKITVKPKCMGKHLYQQHFRKPLCGCTAIQDTDLGHPSSAFGMICWVSLGKSLFPCLICIKDRNTSSRKMF